MDRSPAPVLDLFHGRFHGLFLGLLMGLGLSSCSGGSEPAAPAQAPLSAGEAVVDLMVEAACGQCQFGLEGDGCTLAVRHAGTARFVTGTAIDDHGDAHASDGFCNAVRAARVTGRIEGATMAVTDFELLPPEQP